MASRKRTNKSLPRKVNQSEAQAKSVSQTFSTHLSPEEITSSRIISLEPPNNATEHDLRNVVQYLVRTVSRQAQGQTIPTTGFSDADRAASLRTQNFLKIGPLIFIGSYINEDLHEFIDQIKRD